MNLYEKLMKSNPEDIILLSDTHLYEDDIMKYENWRYNNWFDASTCMDVAWNACTTKNSLVIHLGDVCSSDPYETEKVQQSLENLHGTKILILGNHDRDRSETYWKELGFDYVFPYPIVLNDFFILSHEPLYTSRNSPMVNIHGHVHGDTKFKTVSSNSYCVCPERNDYKPVSLKYIIDEIEKIRKKELGK